MVADDGLVDVRDDLDALAEDEHDHDADEDEGHVELLALVLGRLPSLHGGHSLLEAVGAADPKNETKKNKFFNVNFKST